MLLHYLFYLNYEKYKCSQDIQDSGQCFKELDFIIQSSSGLQNSPNPQHPELNPLGNEFWNRVLSSKEKGLELCPAAPESIAQSFPQLLFPAHTDKHKHMRFLGKRETLQHQGILTNKTRSDFDN